MKYDVNSTIMIDVSRVFLDEENPRHDPIEDQEDIISHLCSKDQVLPLARDIAKIGLNPLELFALLPEGEDTFFVAEGNRRLCAIKLLNDTDLAPANLRKDFEKAAKDWKVISKIPARVFPNRSDVNLWLDRIHAGQADGRGRKQWNADQKARHSGYAKNNRSLAVLDAAKKRELLTKEEGNKKLSVIERYFSNALFRDALGASFGSDGELLTELSSSDFDKVFKKFIRDVATKAVSTRDNKTQIEDYARRLRTMDGLDGSREEKRLVDPEPEPDGKKKKENPKKPTKPTKIVPCTELQKALNDIPSYKLEQLYYSLCSINLYSHTPLLTIGSWSFLETLTAVCGRKADVAFHSFLSNEKLSTLMVGSKQDNKSLRGAVKRIADLGNSTKHNKVASSFNGEQLANDFETMEKMLVALAISAKGKT